MLTGGSSLGWGGLGWGFTAAEVAAFGAEGLFRLPARLLHAILQSAHHAREPAPVDGAGS
jgi:hypothetical protein